MNFIHIVNDNKKIAVSKDYVNKIYSSLINFEAEKYQFTIGGIHEKKPIQHQKPY